DWCERSGGIPQAADDGGRRIWKVGPGTLTQASRRRACPALEPDQDLIERDADIDIVVWRATGVGVRLALLNGPHPAVALECAVEEAGHPGSVLYVSRCDEPPSDARYRLDAKRPGRSPFGRKDLNAVPCARASAHDRPWSASQAEQNRGGRICSFRSSPLAETERIAVRGTRVRHRQFAQLQVGSHPQS